MLATLRRQLLALAVLFASAALVPAFGWQLVPNAGPETPGTSADAAAPLVPDGAILRIAVGNGAGPAIDELLSVLADPARQSVPVGVKRLSPVAALQAFCQSVPGVSPDIVLSPERMPAEMAADCAEAGPGEVTAVELGRSPLVLAVRSGTTLARLTSEQVYLALARDIPYREEFRRNVAIRWSDIDRSLPPLDIRFQVPPRGDGLRIAFETVVLAFGCRSEKLAMGIAAAAERHARCTTMRTDRMHETPRDQAVRALLDAPEGTVGVLSLRDLEQAGDGLVGVELDEVPASRPDIQAAVFDHSNSLWLYTRRGAGGQESGQAGQGGQAANGDRAEVAALVEQIVQWVQSDAVTGPDGLLAGLGVTPLPADERAAQQRALAPQPTPYTIAWATDWTRSILSGAYYVLQTTFRRNRGDPGPGAADLSSLMDLAGYKLQEFDSAIGIVPSATMTFGLVRQMSEADRDALDRALRLDARARTDAVAALQRWVVHSVVDVREDQGYIVSRVELTLFPLPEVRLIVATEGAER